MLKRRGFLLLLGTAVTGLWLPSTQLITLSRQMVIELSGSCSFCSKAGSEVLGLAGIVGRAPRICNECIGLCCDIIGEELGIRAEELGLVDWPLPRFDPEQSGVDLERELEEALASLRISRRELDEFVRADVAVPAPEQRTLPAKLACSFCDAEQHSVRKLIAGPTVYVCDVCTGDALSVMSSVLRA